MSEVGTLRWARNVVAETVAHEISRLTRRGVPGLATGDIGISGHAGVVQPVVRIELPRHAEMPDARRIMEACLPAGPTCTRHASAFAARALVPYARLLMRDVQLVATGCDVDARAANPRRKATSSCACRPTSRSHPCLRIWGTRGST